MKNDRLHTQFLCSPKGNLSLDSIARASERGYMRVKMAFGIPESMFSGEDTSFGVSESVSKIQKDYKIIVF